MELCGAGGPQRTVRVWPAVGCGRSCFAGPSDGRCARSRGSRAVMFFDTSTHAMDAKKRLFVPKRFQGALSRDAKELVRAAALAVRTAACSCSRRRDFKRRSNVWTPRASRHAGSAALSARSSRTRIESRSMPQDGSSFLRAYEPMRGSRRTSFWPVSAPVRRSGARRAGKSSWPPTTSTSTTSIRSCAATTRTSGGARQRWWRGRR